MQVRKHAKVLLCSKRVNSELPQTIVFLYKSFPDSVLCSISCREKAIPRFPFFCIPFHAKNGFDDLKFQKKKQRFSVRFYAASLDRFLTGLFW